MHVSDQFGQAILPLNVRLLLKKDWIHYCATLVKVKNAHNTVKPRGWIQTKIQLCISINFFPNIFQNKQWKICTWIRWYVSLIIAINKLIKTIAAISKYPAKTALNKFSVQSAVKVSFIRKSSARCNPKRAKNNLSMASIKVGIFPPFLLSMIFCNCFGSPVKLASA